MPKMAKRGWNPLPILAAVLVLVAVDAWPQTTMQISTGAFSPGAAIPELYTCSGKNLSPPLSIGGVPAAAKTLALVVYDPDAPAGTFIHWVIYNLPAKTTEIPEGIRPQLAMPGGGAQGRNGFGILGYGGPCPPPGTPHHYHFRLIALNARITPQSPFPPAIDAAMQGHVIGSAEFIGTYGR
jgi:Raf kinase inhibitor-like YbhB/YbcL family protein